MTTMTDIKERPILFSGAMVQAILEGRKTQTRRIVKPQPVETITGDMHWPIKSRAAHPWPPSDYTISWHCPYGQAGDRLWVRETWCKLWFDRGQGWNTYYRADDNLDYVLEAAQGQWKPSIHMPRTYGRITLEITDVRVERLREITEEDALAEGIQASTMPPIPGTWHHAVNGHMCQTARMAFSVLWDSINGNDNLPIGQGKDWESNPWVWVVSFQRI